MMNRHMSYQGNSQTGNPMSGYAFDRILSNSSFKIQIDTVTRYGFFKHVEFGHACAGGLWFAEDGLTLTHFSGLIELPESVASALRGAGFIVLPED